MFAVGHVPEQIECFVAVVTVAIVSVDAADAPVGAGDGAELVSLGQHRHPDGADRDRDHR